MSAARAESPNLAILVRSREAAFSRPIQDVRVSTAIRIGMVGQSHCRFRQTTSGPGHQLRQTEIEPKAEERGRPAKSPPRIPQRRGQRYSGTITPDPPNSAGKSLSLGSPSFIGRTVSE